MRTKRKFSCFLRLHVRKIMRRPFVVGPSGFDYGRGLYVVDYLMGRPNNNVYLRWYVGKMKMQLKTHE